MLQVIDLGKEWQNRRASGRSGTKGGQVAHGRAMLQVIDLGKEWQNRRASGRSGTKGGQVAHGRTWGG